MFFAVLFLSFLLVKKMAVGQGPSFRGGKIRSPAGNGRVRVVVTSKEGPASDFVPATAVIHYEWPEEDKVAMTISLSDSNRLEQDSNITVKMDVRRFLATDPVPNSMPVSQSHRTKEYATDLHAITNPMSQTFDRDWAYRAMQAGQLRELVIRDRGIKFASLIPAWTQATLNSMTRQYQDSQAPLIFLGTKIL